MFGRKKQHNLLRARMFWSKTGPDRPVAWIKPALFGVSVVAVVAFMVLLPFGMIAVRVYGQALSGRDDLLAAEQAVEALDVDLAIDLVDAAEEKFTVALRETEKLRYLAFVPYVGERVEAADSLLTAGISTAAALGQALEAGRDVLAVISEVEGLDGTISSVLPDAATLYNDLTPRQKRQILAGLARAAPRIGEAIGQLDAALFAIDDMPDNETVRSLKARLEPMRIKIGTLRGSLSAILPAAEILPGVLGYPEEKHYLLVFQNDTELRPTGGFLSMVGEFVIRDADLITVEVNDVYSLDGPAEATVRPPPPPPIRKYIGIDEWYLRDANWSPDFVSAAETIERFYKEEYIAAHPQAAEPRIDGIIAVTPRLAEDILRVTGPITIDTYKFDADNLVDELEFQVEKNFIAAGVPFDQRKAVVGKLFQEMIDRVSSFSLAQLIGLIGNVHRNLDQGSILMLSKDPALQRLILENDWGGRLRDVRGDYLAVIDANLASLKSDPMVSRSIKYSVVPDGGGLTGKVAVTYVNRGTFTWKTTRYRTYTRVYLPEGSELIGVAGAMENDKLKDPARRPGQADSGSELDRRYFGAFIAVEPGESRTLEFTFKLAPTVVKMASSGDYVLDVDKQAGTLGRGLTLDLDFGKKLTTAEPAEDPREFGDTKYRLITDLDIDRHFEVRF